MDLAVCAAILSSYHDIPLSSKVCFAGEVGLGGEIRSVNQVDNRILEAGKLGFEQILISKHQGKSQISTDSNITVITSGKLNIAFSDLGAFDF